MGRRQENDTPDNLVLFTSVNVSDKRAKNGADVTSLYLDVDNAIKLANLLGEIADFKDSRGIKISLQIKPHDDKNFDVAYAFVDEKQEREDNSRTSRGGSSGGRDSGGRERSTGRGERTNRGKTVDR